MKLLFISLLFIFTCDCYNHTDGVVYSFTTGQPIPDVEVETWYLGDLYKMNYTDSNGRFRTVIVCNESGDRNFTIKLKKSGYFSQEFISPSETLEVRMKDS